MLVVAVLLAGAALLGDRFVIGFLGAAARLALLVVAAVLLVAWAGSR